MIIAALTLGLALQGPVELDATIKSLYSVISGPAGQNRDWDKFQALFAPEAKMRTIRAGTISILTPEDYVKRAGPVLETRGFFEKETKRKVDLIGGMAHVWSSYASFNKADDKEPFATGVNSIQLAKTKDGWKIYSISWTEEK